MNGNGMSGYWWSGRNEQGTLSFPLRLLCLPFYLLGVTWHCLRGTPIYVLMGDRAVVEEGVYRND